MITSFLASTALAAESVRLYGATDNRARVVHAAYAFDPGTKELRVRLTLQNRQVKSGRYRDPQVIRHMLSMLSASTGKLLFCVYEGNAILSIYIEQRLGH